MFRAEKVEVLQEQFNDLFVNGNLFHDDLYRVNNFYYSKGANPYIYKNSVILMGCRSGLEILIYNNINKDIKIYIIEQNTDLHEKIKKLPVKNLKLYETIDEFLLRETDIDFDLIRTDSRHFHYEQVMLLLSKKNISAICGEILETDCNPIELYRFCNKNVDFFYFQVKDKKHPITGVRKKKNQPEVSVVVAAYGVEAYIDECIESLVAQTLTNIEILIVDDGSVDLTGTKADEWAVRFPKIVRVIHKENGGCASARQRGLEEAKGEYIAFVDGDDFVEPLMYESLYENAVLLNAEISQCGFYEFYEGQTKKYFPTAWGADGQNGTSGLIQNPIEYLTLKPSIWRRIHKKTFLDKYKIEFPVHIRRFDDLPFSFLTMARAQRVCVIPDCYYAYRLNRPGQDVAITDKRLYVHFEIFEWLYQAVRPWASMAVMKQLRAVEVATHDWGLSRLNKPLKKPYLEQVLKDIRARYAPYTEDSKWVLKLKKNIQ